MLIPENLFVEPIQYMIGVMVPEALCGGEEENHDEMDAAWNALRDLVDDGSAVGGNGLFLDTKENRRLGGHGKG
jgi:hypothetical protein